MGGAEDRTGRRYGDLVVVERVGTYRSEAVWLCVRDDGRTVTKRTHQLTAVNKRLEREGRISPWTQR